MGAAERAQPANETGRGASVFRPLSIWDQMSLSRGPLSPHAVNHALRQADCGIMAPLVDVANEARQKFSDLHNALETRETAIQTLPWEIYFPGDENKRRKGSREKKFVEEKLLEHPGLGKLLAHQIGAVYYGYAVSETIWGKDKRGRMYPVRWIHHHPRRFGFDPDTGKLVQRDINGALTGIDFQARWPGRFIVSQPRITGDVAWREGLMRLLVWLALFGTYGLSDWMKLGELIWRPLRMAKHKNGAATKEIDSVQNGLTNLSADSAFTFSEDFEVTVEFPSVSGTAPHEALLRYVGQAINKAINGQVLTADAGTVGSQALGNVHNEIRKERREGDARNIWGDISDQLIFYMVGWNFGAMDRPLRARAVTDDSVDVVAFATAVEKLTKARVKLVADWVRDRVGAPQPKEGDELVGDTPPEDDAAKPAPDDEEEKDTE